MAVKVLLLGARGTGKTTFLASAYHEFNHMERFYRNVSLIDKTHYGEGIRRENIIHPISRIYDLIGHIGQDQNSLFALDFINLSYGFWEYSFRLADKSVSNWIDLDFIDISGSMMGYSMDYQMIKEYVRNSDVIVVSIDTPVMMGPVENNPACHCS